MNHIIEPIKSFKVEELRVSVFDNPASLAAKAAEELKGIIAESVAARGVASIVLSTGNSMLEFMSALRRLPNVPWNKVQVFHLDEYLGMSEDHPASFRRYLRENLVDVVHPRDFFSLNGDSQDSAAEIQRYTRLLHQYPADVCVIGIGENGHLAFNDPPAKFETPELVHIVELDEACRRQQVGEGHFAVLEDVPQRAFSLTIPALLAARHVLGVVPEKRKAQAVKRSLQGPVTPQCPASILQTQPQARLFLDRDSSSLLTGI